MFCTSGTLKWSVNSLQPIQSVIFNLFLIFPLLKFSKVVFPNFSKMLSILNNFYLSWHTWKTFSACKLWTIDEEVFHLKMFLECVKHSRETSLNLKSDMKFVKIMQTLVTTLKHYEWENHRTWSDMSKWGRRRRRNWFAIECLLFIPVVFSLCYQGE